MVQSCFTLTCFQVREVNLYKEAYQKHLKMDIDPENLTRCWNECMEKSSYYKRKMTIEEFNKQNYWKKKGIAIIPLKVPTGFSDQYLNQVNF